MKSSHFLIQSKGVVALFFVLLFFQCSDDHFQPATNLSSALTSSTLTTTSISSDCAACTYVVPANVTIVDGTVLKLLPGSVIGLSASTPYKNLIFRNIVGTATNPIIIRNCGGTATLDGTGLAYTIKTEGSMYFRITGGNVNNVYGIKINGGHMGITLGGLSTNFEVDHVEIANSGFAGIMAKTDPSCDDATIRGNFTMKDITLRHNYVHDCGGEGFYVGNSFYENGMNTACGLRLPHEIWNLRLFGNIVRNSGWDGIQVGCVTRAGFVFGNTVENFGLANIAGQRNGIQIGSGTGGSCYNNLVRNGTGNGIIVLGLGDNLIYNNVIVQAGESGIFCDERYTPGSGFKFINNTIISPKVDGIRIYAELVPRNVVKNNIIVSPGSYATYPSPRTTDDSFIFKLSSSQANVDASNNFFTNNLSDVQFLDITGNYKVSITSPVIDRGADIDAYLIRTDFYNKKRLKGETYDIGAAENF